MKIHNLNCVVVAMTSFSCQTLIFDIAIASPMVIALVLLNRIIADITKGIEVA